MVHKIWHWVDEIVVNGIDDSWIVIKAEVRDFLCSFSKLSEVVSWKSYDHCRTRLLIVFFALDNNHIEICRDHSCHEGSLNPQKYVVACDDFGADVALRQNRYGFFGIVFD